MGYLDTIAEVERQLTVKRTAEYEVYEPSLATSSTACVQEHQTSRNVCQCCSGERFWRSTQDAVICFICHPPAHKCLVVEIVDERLAVDTSHRDPGDTCWIDAWHAIQAWLNNVAGLGADDSRWTRVLPILYEADEAWVGGRWTSFLGAIAAIKRVAMLAER